MDKWFKKKKKHLKTKYEDFIHLRTKKYYYTLGVMKVIKATKGEYYFNSMAYKKALNYHKRTVIIPDARRCVIRLLHTDALSMVEGMMEV